jgi:2-keto-4-pentenoate hydratase
MLAAMDQQLIARLAQELADATERRTTIDLLSQRHPELGLAEAYEIQRLVMQRRLAGGERLAGWKVGYTNLPAQQAAGTDRPMYGPIYASAIYRDGRFPCSPYVAPRAEPEVCFLLRADLNGPDVTEQDVVAATEVVLPALEMVQRHYHGPPSRAVDAVADGGAHAGLVLPSSGVSPAGLDLAAVSMTLEKNGAQLAAATGAIVLGHPARPVAWLVHQLAALGLGLKAGDLISSGTLAGAHAVAPGDRLRLHYPELGTLEVTVTA